MEASVVNVKVKADTTDLDAALKKAERLLSIEHRPCWWCRLWGWLNG